MCKEALPKTNEPNPWQVCWSLPFHHYVHNSTDTCSASKCKERAVADSPQHGMMYVYKY
jgi:hypothetical protein